MIKDWNRDLPTKEQQSNALSSFGEKHYPRWAGCVVLRQLTHLMLIAKNCRLKNGNGVCENIFGPLNAPPGEDSDELTFRYVPGDGETCQIQVRHVRLIRGCERLEEAMTEVGIAAWASQFHGKYPWSLDTARHATRLK
jgi:hypothetical protein